MSLFLAAYFVGGLLTLLAREQEIFPVYSWFLFALVPTGNPRYALLLHEVNGRAIAPPRLYQEADDLLGTAHSITVFKLTQQFGNMVQHHPSSQNPWREILEKNWLPAGTHYELVKINGDPVERWRNHRFVIAQHLQMFTNAEPAK